MSQQNPFLTLSLHFCGHFIQQLTQLF